MLGRYVLLLVSGRARNGLVITARLDVAAITTNERPKERMRVAVESAEKKAAEKEG